MKKSVLQYGRIKSEVAKCNIGIIQNIFNATIYSQAWPKLQINSACIVMYKDEFSRHSLLSTAVGIISISYAIRYIYYGFNLLFSDQHFFDNRNNIVSQLRYLVLYIDGHDNLKIADELIAYAPKLLRRILNENYRFDMLFKQMLDDFSKFSIFDKDLKK